MTEPNVKPTYRISDLHEADRPRERLASLGPQALTNAELLAILLRVGVRGENAVEVGQTTPAQQIQWTQRPASHAIQGIDGSAWVGRSESGTDQSRH